LADNLTVPTTILRFSHWYSKLVSIISVRFLGRQRFIEETHASECTTQKVIDLDKYIEIFISSHVAVTLLSYCVPIAPPTTLVHLIDVWGSINHAQLLHGMP
jgi:hypothetical protein